MDQPKPKTCQNLDWIKASPDIVCWTKYILVLLSFASIVRVEWKYAILVNCGPLLAELGYLGAGVGGPRGYCSWALSCRVLSGSWLLFIFDWWCPGDREGFVWSPKNATFSRKAAIVHSQGRSCGLYCDSEFHFVIKASPPPHRQLNSLSNSRGHSSGYLFPLGSWVTSTSYVPALCLYVWSFWVLEETSLGLAAVIFFVSLISEEWEKAIGWWIPLWLPL